MSITTNQARGRSPGAEKTASGQLDVDLAGLHSTFESFLAELSTAFSIVAPEKIEEEIGRWLDRLAQQLGVEQCTVAEFYGPEEQPHFLPHWIVGKHLQPFVSDDKAWIQGELASGQVISISALDELPAEAASTRKLLQQVGIRSGLWVPVQVEGVVVGGIGFTMMSQERAWPKLITQRCRLVAEVFGNALLRRRRSAEVEERSQFEMLVTDIAAKFVDATGDLPALIDDTLRELGEFLKSDRVSYLEIDAKEKSLMPTRQWLAEGIEVDTIDPYVDVSPDFRWLVAKILRNKPAIIHSLDDFPERAGNERQYCESCGIQSFIMVPASTGGEPSGALALDTIRGTRTWNDRIVQRLRIVAAIIAAAQDRHRKRYELEELRRFEQAVSQVSTTFVNLPPDAVDDKIEAGLKVIAEAIGADLITLLQPRHPVGIDVTHEWASDAFGEYTFKGTQVDQAFVWLADQLTGDKPVVISTLSQFPAEAVAERTAMEKAGLASVLWAPFRVSGELAGHLAINTIKQKTWPEELIPQLRLLGEVFGEALRRRDAELALQKAFTEIDALKEQLEQENVYLRQEAKLNYSHDDIVGSSGALREALTKVEQVAPTDSTVLILGETGTGKELLARAIHNSSRRKERIMVKINCAALPASLVEAELFGREKGAYTGALSREPGRFEIADGSTILLDEVGELPLELQAKLLRVLQDGQFERLGSSKTLKVDVRVVAATNRDLMKAVEDKEFREDLYYRLNVFPIEVPPLRERFEDIPQLAWAFVQEFSETMGKSIETVSRKTMEALRAYGWPGNVRELRNVIERAMIVSRGPELEVELPRNKAASHNSSRNLADIEREHIRAVLESVDWRVRGEAGAAEILGLKPTTLEARMKKLEIKRG